MALVFWSSTGLKLRPELVLLMGEGIDPLSVLRVDRPCTSNIQDPLNTVIDGQNPGDRVLRFWISWMNYVELTTVFTRPCGAESCPSNVWQPNTFWHWAEEFGSCIKKRWFREISDWIWVHHITCLFFSLRVYPRNTALSCFICLVFFADHWLCCVEVSADIEPLEYTPKPECPVDPVESCLPTPRDSYDFMGWRTKSCASLNAWNTGFNSITFTWSSSMDHATYAIMMKWYEMILSDGREWATPDAIYDCPRFLG